VQVLKIGQTIFPPYAGGYAQILGTPMTTCSTAAIIVAMAKRVMVGADNIAQLQGFYDACTSFPGKKRATTATTATTMLKTTKTSNNRNQHHHHWQTFFPP
jgi:hypothetical protein